MTVRTLGSLDILQTSFSGFTHPARVDVVQLLAADPSLAGNAVLQSGSLGYRQATLTWVADTDDKNTARGYADEATEIEFVDHEGVTRLVRIIAFDTELNEADLWICNATLIQTGYVGS